MLKKIMLRSVVAVGVVSTAIAGGLEPQDKPVAAQTSTPVQASSASANETATKTPLCGALGASLSYVNADYKSSVAKSDDNNYGFGVICTTTPIFGFNSEAELAYTKWNDDTVNYVVAGSPLSQSSKVNSIEMTLKASKDLTPSLSLFVKGGIARGRVTQVIEITGLLLSNIRETDTAPIFGYGLDYKLTDTLKLRLDHSEVEWKKSGGTADVSGTKFSLVRYFN